MPPVHPGKKAAGEKAAEYVQSGMIVGLGTGSTAYWAIEKIGRLVSEGLQIKALATSRRSEEQARRLNIPLVSFADIDHIDIDIDGADEVDDGLNLIKGGGGALLREKIIAAASRKMIVVADDSKLVESLGKFPLPVEVTPFGWEMTSRKLQALDCTTALRKKEDDIFITDNANYIIDCSFGKITSPTAVDRQLKNIPGVVENGLFISMAAIAVIGYEDGSTRIMS